MIVNILIVGTGIFLFFLLSYCILRTSIRTTEFMVNKRIIPENAQLFIFMGLFISLLVMLILFAVYLLGGLLK